MPKTKEEHNAYMREYTRKNNDKIRVQRKAWRDKNHERVLQSKAKYRAKNREELSMKETNRYHAVQRPRDNEAIMKALRIYGGQCQACGDDDIVILQWHHRNGDRKTHNESNVNVSKRIVAAGERLDDIMLLCAGCHIHQDLADGTSNKSSRMREIAELWGE